MSEKIEKTKNQKPFLNLLEACKYLSVKPSTLYSYNCSRIIPYYRIRGRRIFYRIEDLQNFVLNEKNLVKSEDQINKEAEQHILEKDPGGDK